MITIDLPKPPSVNALYSNVPGRGREKTRLYRDWIEAAGWQLLSQKPAVFEGPVDITLVFADEGRADLDNLSKAPVDLLVKHGIIKDDSRKYVRRIVKEWSSDVEGCRVHMVAHAEKQVAHVSL